MGEHLACTMPPCAGNPVRNGPGSQSIAIHTDQECVRYLRRK